MSGSHDSGMATASSTAAPKLRLSSGAVTGVPPRNTTTHSTIERMNTIGGMSGVEVSSLRTDTS